MRAREAVYVDTSVWCAFCFNESETPGAVRWLANADLDRTGTAVWTQTEFASAVGLKLRAKGLPARKVAQAHAAFEQAFDMTLQLNVIREDFEAAARLCKDARSGLRAGDALHLAVAMRHGCSGLASLDAVMNQNAKRLGLKLVEMK